MDKPKSWVIEQKAITGLSFIVFVLVCLPLPGFLKNRNIGCSLYGIWIAFLCLTTFIHCIIWRDNAINSAPVWCEIYIRFQYASSVGILSAALVIARRVSLISTSSPAVLLSHNMMRGMCIDLAIGLSPPMAQIIEYWFLAGHRFDILEGLGCYPAIPFSILDICLRWIWLFIIGLTSAYYCVRTLLALRRRQKEIKEVLFAANIDKQLYYRLVAMACVEISCTLPLVTYLVVGARTEYYPWKGFADLHYKFSRIDQYPYALWAAFPGAAQVTQWFQIGCGLVYFLLLGLTRDARSRYAKMLGLSKLFQSLTGDIMPTSTGKKSRRSTNFPWRKRHTAQRPTPHHVSTDLHFNSCPTSITESGLATSDIDHTMESV